MFSSTYQNGDTGVEIISTAGKGPNPRLVKASNIPKEYDRDIKGYKYILTQQASLQCPAASGRDTLGLIQPLLIFQLRCPHDDDILNLEIVVLDTDNQRRRFHISTTFRSLEPHSLHVQIPWIQTDKSQWTNVVFSLDTLVMHFFRTKFQSLDSFHLRPNCYLRKVFTLPTTSACRDSSSGADGSTSLISSIVIPTAFEYPTGTTFSSFLFPSTTETIKSALHLSKQQSTGSEAPSSTVLGGARNGGLGGGLVVAGQKIGSKQISRHADSSPARRLQSQDPTPSQQLPKPPKTVAGNTVKNQHQQQQQVSLSGRMTVGSLVASNLLPPNSDNFLTTSTDEQSKPTKRSVAVGCDSDVHVKEQPQFQSDKVSVEATSASNDARPIDEVANKILAALLPDSVPRSLSSQEVVVAAATVESPPPPSSNLPFSSSLRCSTNSCDEQSRQVRSSTSKLSTTHHISQEVVSSSQSSQPPLPPSSLEEQMDHRLTLSLSLSSSSLLSQSQRVAAATANVGTAAAAVKILPADGICVGSFDDSMECFSLDSPSPSHNDDRHTTDKENDEKSALDLQGSYEIEVVPLQTLRSRLEEIEDVLTKEERAFAAEFGSEELTKI